MYHEYYLYPLRNGPPVPITLIYGQKGEKECFVGKWKKNPTYGLISQQGFPHHSNVGKNLSQGPVRKASDMQSCLTHKHFGVRARPQSQECDTTQVQFAYFIPQSQTTSPQRPKSAPSLRPLKCSLQAFVPRARLKHPPLSPGPRLTCYAALGQAAPLLDLFQRSPNFGPATFHLDSSDV